MARWTFEPGHTAAEFSVRHMMVSWVRGHFKNARGSMEFDPDNPAGASLEARIDVRRLWTGEPDRDAHLKSADFLDIDNHPQITFRSTRIRQVGGNHFRVSGDLTIRGVCREVTLDVEYLGQWETPFWAGDKDYGPVTRAGFVGRLVIDRNDFGAKWSAALGRGGSVVADEVHITLDVEAIREKPGLPVES